MDTSDLRSPAFYINRELSLLEFNRRVLAQALDEATPLLERLRFLCISSLNLDEFFEIRVAGLTEKNQLGAQQGDADQTTPMEVLKAVHHEARCLVEEQYKTLNDIIIPALAAEGIRLIRRSDWTSAQERWLLNYFKEELLPVLSPLGLDPAHPFPRILNKSLNFIVSLKGKDAFGRNSGVALVQAPRALPRVIQLPPEIEANGSHDFVFLSSIIHAYVEDLFPGMKALGCYQFRVTRNSDLFVDEEEVEDLLRAVEGELVSRRYGKTVRLEVADNCTEDMAAYLLTKFDLGPDDLYQVNGPVNLSRLLAICDTVDRPDLKYPPFSPAIPPALAANADMFENIKRNDILLHHPFQSFTPVIDFLRQASQDPKVLAIKQTLYRTGPKSAIADALVAAAKADKEVTVVVELRARFDEEENIALANRLQEAGAHVVYGVVGYKTHAKMLMVVRREGKRLRHYVHLSTGNYHPKTAQLYTDYGLFTCDKVIGEDVHKVFLQLTSLGKMSKLGKLLQAPFSLHEALLAKLQREMENARQGRPARIIIKLNALIEPQIIQKLYQASSAGVDIDLIVRGMCGLRPGIPGISERIRVRSIIGRLLEHTRVYYFENGGEPEVYLSSADWMERNFFRRVEIAFPIETAELRDRIIQDLHGYLQDNTQSWILQYDGSYVQLKVPKKQTSCSAQTELLEQLSEHQP